jgi:hypothetical protein
MALPTFILFPHGPTWQIASVAGGQVSFADMLPPQANQPAPPARQIAERLAQELSRLGYTGQGVMLALASTDCLAASIDIAGLPRGDRKALLYRLEEKLPMPAESVVADFVGSSDHSLGVCIREDAVSPLVHALESCGVAVQSISPAALLAAQQLTEAGDSQAVLVGEEDKVSLVATRNGLPIHWSLLPARPGDVILQLDMLALESNEQWPLRSCGVDAATLGEILASGVSIPPRQVTAIAGAAVLEGRLKPWIEFRRGALAISDRLRLHRSALDGLLSTAAIFLICLTLGLLWRAHRYHREAGSADQRMADEFSVAFPGWPRPSNIKVTVDAEHRKLGSPASGALPLEARESAVRMLHAILSRLPSDLKFRIESLAFTELTFELQGRVRAFGDVDTMAAAARSTGAEVPPPQAHRDAEGFWNFTLRGTKQTAIARQ